MATKFLGEHLVPGQLGYFFVILSFVAALFSAFSYFKSVRAEITNPLDSRQWKNMGRGGFIIHFIAVIGIFAALFYIIESHLFEYHYAWEHSSRSLPAKYLLSCFWEGQEGSFMLWTFWHSVLGLIIMRTAKGLETRTMAIIALTQVFLGTMILGLYMGHDIKIGSTPFILLRNAMQGAPIFSSPNYMSFIADGNGLNVSLQNYWMVIHPPVLFLGFALTLIPFALCIAALWKGDYKSFVKPALVWSLAGGGVLGTGIMMGGRWAYESLNFGGYWAWDPVENASLVPWIVLVAGLHTLLVYRSTGRALIISFVFLLMSNLLVWYSTFLTRTGILGKTSVHAFTGDGEALFYHLLVVIGLLLILSIGMLVWRWKKLPRIKNEEEVLSREFWMFIGSVILFIGSVHIILETSIPVWSPLAKWITGKDFAPPLNVMKSYNDVQVWIAIVVGLLAGMVLFMKYKRSDAVTVWKRLGLVTAIAIMLTLAVGYSQHITTPQYAIMLFSCFFGIVASIYHGIAIQKTKIKNLGPSVAHLGFALVLLGILLSSYNKHAISFNTAGFNIGSGEPMSEEKARENNENEVLFLGSTVAMGDYYATYFGDSSVPGKDKRIYYKVKFEKVDSVTHKVTERFNLYPDAFINPKGNEGLAANPDTKHYASHDVYTFISQATDKTKSDTSTYRSHMMHKPGDTIFLSRGYMVFGGLTKNVQNKNYAPAEGDLSVAADFKVYSLQGLVQDLQPAYVIHNKESVERIEDTVRSMDVYARLENIVVKSKDSVTAEIMVKQTDPKDDYIVLKALVFPYINVLWAGVIIMVLGFFISLGKLVRTKQATLEQQ